MAIEYEMLTAVGFPAFMCLWFMYRLEAVIKNNSDALNKNSDILAIAIDKYSKSRKN